jgi:16S rRNA U516 pseudouridylate synthase RsuA-like enzyme
VEKMPQSSQARPASERGGGSLRGRGGRGGARGGGRGGVGGDKLRFVLREGRNRQIRKMLSALG